MGRKKAMKRARNKDKKKARAEYKKTGLFFKSLLKAFPSRNK